jgi:Mg2+ and Co2+ transporter CorA
MNVPVPGEGTPYAFWLILGLMAAVLVVLVLVFRRRGWL